MSLSVLLVAEEAAGLHALRNVIDSGGILAGVLTSGDPARGSQGLAETARAFDIRRFHPDDIGTPALATAARAVDILLNVHALHILPPGLLAAPKIGAFNLHPGPLPQYAGLSVPSWAILAGERRHAVTLHWMEAEVDTGPIAYAAELDISARETGISLSLKCVREGLRLVSRLLDDAGAATACIPRQAQNLADRRLYTRRPRGGLPIEWTRPAAEIDRMVRAADYAPFPSPWPSPSTSLGGVAVEILRTSPHEDEANLPCEPGRVAHGVGSSVLVATGTEWLRVERVRVNGASRAAAEVLPVGARLGPVARSGSPVDG